MKCPNCAKAIRTKAIRCPRCGSSLTEEEPQEAMNAELYARVKALVVEQTRASAEKINPDTLLADDLGIAGDDGCELLEKYGQTRYFVVSLSMHIVKVIHHLDFEATSSQKEYEF